MKRFQNKAAESRLALPVVTMFATGIWLLNGLITEQWYAQLAILFISTYLMAEMNNAYALLQTCSRMVSCSFLALSSMSVFLIPQTRVSVCMLSLIMFCTIIFHTYQDRESQGLAFNAFLCLGVASVAFVQILFFVPFVWLMMLFYLMAFNGRMLAASLLGLLMPYWLLALPIMYFGKGQALLQHFTEIAHFQPLFHYENLTLNQIISFVFVAILALQSITHYILKGQLDRIRTRMFYHFFIGLDILTVVFLILQPQHFNMLFGMMITCTCPMLAHFITHTHSRLSNIMFYTMIVCLLLITAFNLWMPSSTF